MIMWLSSWSHCSNSNPTVSTKCITSEVSIVANNDNITLILLKLMDIALFQRENLLATNGSGSICHDKYHMYIEFMYLPHLTKPSKIYLHTDCWLGIAKPENVSKPFHQISIKFYEKCIYLLTDLITYYCNYN